jgi:3-hydroxyisobutyrate dehydrogenase-like beta-hydroxyacid dehydrogenase
MRFTVFGLGEAGSLIAADLAAAGQAVRGYDPADVTTPPGVERCDDPRVAVAEADVVLALTASADAPTAIRQALDEIPATAVYADVSTSSAAVKRMLGELAAARGLGFADVALMSIVPGNGLRTPALASGPAAAALEAVLAPLGMPIEAVGEQPGDAATRKLLRSVVIKGLAALLIEAMNAADAAGFADETWQNLVAQFTAADGIFLRRMIEGTAPHAVRRLHEMEAAAELLADLGVDPVMTRSTIESLRRVPTDGLPRLPR